MNQNIPRAVSVRVFLFLYLKCLMMKNLLMTRFFALLAEDWKENLETRVYEDAIREFTSEIRMLCDTEKDYVGLVRMLEQTRIGLNVFREMARLKKNGRVRCYINVALKLVVAEERSLRKRMSLMKDFGCLKGGQVDIRWKSKAYKMMILEMIEGLTLVQELYSPQGNLLDEEMLAAMVANVFGVEFPNCRQLIDQLFARKKGVTPFLDQMVMAIRLEADKRNEWKGKKK